MTEWWFSSERMTVAVETDRAGVITRAAPIVRKFKGQHVRKLADWMRRQGGFRWRQIG